MNSVYRSPRRPGFRPRSPGYGLHESRSAGAEEALALPLYEDQELEQRLLRMQAVLRLVPDGALRPVDDLGGDFLAAMRRQAVHEERVLFRRAHHLRVDLPVAKRPPALLVLGLEPHRGPDVGRDE